MNAKKTPIIIKKMQVNESFEANSRFEVKSIKLQTSKHIVREIYIRVSAVLK